MLHHECKLENTPTSPRKITAITTIANNYISTCYHRPYMNCCTWIFDVQHFVEWSNSQSIITKSNLLVSNTCDGRCRNSIGIEKILWIVDTKSFRSTNIHTYIFFYWIEQRKTIPIHDQCWIDMVAYQPVGHPRRWISPGPDDVFLRKENKMTVNTYASSLSPCTFIHVTSEILPPCNHITLWQAFHL